MTLKKYSSYKEIELDLEILKLEKELSFQKLIWNGQRIKESFALTNLINELLVSLKSMLYNSYGVILSTAIPILIKFLSNKKRGD